MNVPVNIIVEDEDGGFILARYKETRETPDEEYIPVYQKLEYYHTLESALRDV